MANYRVDVVDLSVAGDRQTLVDLNSKVSFVYVSEFTAGSDVKIHFGTAEGIPITEQGMNFELDPCEPENDGVFLTFPAQPGTTITLTVSFDRAPVNVTSP